MFLSASCEERNITKESASSSPETSEIYSMRRTHLDVLTDKVGNFFSVDTLLVDGTRRHLLLSDDTFTDGDTVIVVTESRSLVNDTSTGSVGNVSISYNLESSIHELSNNDFLHFVVRF